MNRYQIEVAEFDRKRRRMARVLSCVGAVILIACALWSAGVPSKDWWRSVQSWVNSHAERRDDSPSAPSELVLPSAAAPSIASKVLSGTESSVSEMPRPLYLIATTPGRNPREGSALIGANPDNTQTYLAGALLVNGAQLLEIHRDHVVLTRDGKRAELRVYKRDVGIIGDASELVQVGGGSGRLGKPKTPGTRVLLTDYLRPSPMFSDGVLTGYQVYPGTKPSVFHQLGLQSGDVIVAFDSVPLADPQQAFSLLDDFLSGQALVATILRGKDTLRVTLDGSLILREQQHAQDVAVEVPVWPATPPI